MTVSNRSAARGRIAIGWLPLLLLPLLGSGALAAEPLAIPSSNARAEGNTAEVSPETHSVARLWNEALLEAIRRDVPRVSVHARNLFHVSASMYDAWAAYSDSDLGFYHHESATVPDDRSLMQAREEAISFAAYRVLSHRFENSPGHDASQADFDALMDTLGFDPALDDSAGDRPYAIGNRVAAMIIEHGLEDGANEPANYIGPGGYTPINLPMLVALPGTSGLVDINAWQPLIPPGGTGPQGFLTSHWGSVMPFSMERPDDSALYVDPGPQPLVGGIGDAQLRADVVELIYLSSLLDPDDSGLINISPGVVGNNPPGSDSGSGHPLNPITGEPYADQLVREGDWGRVLAEFWEDGPESSTPPGHWTEIANIVSDALDEKRLTGQGPVIDDLEWDIKLYLALHGAIHDAGIASWEVKTHYNSSRPITLIRGMAEYGQSTDPDAANYHPDGLPLIDELIELITTDSSQPGERHAHLSDHVGEVAIRAWQGHPDDPDIEHGGVGWIRGVSWLPYQAEDFVTPPFAGYISAHSVFSRASAEVLTALTGSEFFPGGMAEFEASADGGDYSLRFEYGPSEPLTLQWATYYDASDESGLSRVYGGIHPPFDDFSGRIMGQTIGTEAVAEALAYFSPIGQTPPDRQPHSVPANNWWALLVLALAVLVLGRSRVRSYAA